MFNLRAAISVVCLGAMMLSACAGGGGGGASLPGATPAGPATQLAITTQPGGAIELAPFGIQPVVQVRDAAGILCSSDNSTQITAALSGGTGGATLGGTFSKTVQNGVASFSNVSISVAGSGYTLTFSANPTLTPASTSSFNVAAASAGGGSAPFIPAAPTGAATRFVSPTGLDTNSGATASTPWRTLQKAADMAQPGDIIDIADGSYSRFTIANKGTMPATPPATQGTPIIFRATGTGAIINSGTSSSTSPDNRDAIKITHCNGIIIHGLRTTNAYRAGCRVDDCYYVTVQAGVFGDGGVWGIFTDFVDHLQLIGNECFGSREQHGIYHSNSGDHGIIRGNYVHNNAGSGIQCNGDGSQLDASMGTRGDGWIEDTIVERNLIVDCGGGTQSIAGATGAGGAAVNLSCARSNIIRNNLILNNFASGIAGSDNGLGVSWGAHSNQILHNTIIFRPAQGRHCLIIKIGSYGWTIKNNICIAGARGAAEFHTDSLPGIVSDYNLFYSIGGWPLFTNETTSTNYTFAQWKTLTGGDANSQNANATFTDAAAGDYSLAAGSPGRDQGVNAGVTGTYDGGTRPMGGAPDMGCYER
jgi:hypothetical protein